MSEDLDLGSSLIALGRNLQVPEVDLVGPVRLAIDAPLALRRWNQRTTMLAAAAAILLVVLLAVLTIAPARKAVADWLGIGRTSVDVVDTLPPADPPIRPTSSVTSVETSTPAAPGDTYDDLRRDAQGSLAFEIRLPDHSEVGPIRNWELRPTGATTELVVFWDEFTLTQRPDSELSPFNSKLVLSADTLTDTTIDGATEALWIEGVHVRISGTTTDLSTSVLLWVDEEVEYRLEGDIGLERARTLAASLG